MTRRIEILRESWPLARPFAISRGVKTAAETIVCVIEENGLTGRGECTPYARYGETPDSVVREIEAMAPALAQGATRAAIAGLMPPGAGRNAVDCALWDLQVQQNGAPAWRLAGLPAPAPVVTAFTISLGPPAEMQAQAEAARAYPLLQLKLGGDDPLACVRAARRGAPAARLVADANEGWGFAQLRAIAPELAALGVELVEQPLPAADDHALEGWPSPILLCADESFHTAGDVATAARRYGAVNVKLDKTGGFTEAVAAARAAKAAGLKVMVGCMVASSLAMAPAALIAGLADYVDLDGPLLLKADRPGGFAFHDGLMQPAPAGLWG